MFSIRKAELKDCRSLSTFAKEAFVEAHQGQPMIKDEDMHSYTKECLNEKKIAEEQLDPKSIFFLAIKGATIVGYAKINLKRSEECVVATNPTELQRIYVGSECKGMGIGKLLLTHCIDVAIKNNSDVIWLGVWDYNLYAQEFYKRNGFSCVGSQCFVFGSYLSRDFVYQKTLLK